MSLASFRRFAVVALALTTASGCAHIGLGADSPTVATRGVSVRSASAVSVLGTVHLQVANPNAFALPLQRARFHLDIGGAELATGDIDLPATIPAKATAPIDASIAIGGSSAAAAAARYAAGARAYTLRGTLFFSTRLGVVEVAVSHSGTLDELAAIAARTGP